MVSRDFGSVDPIGYESLLVLLRIYHAKTLCHQNCRFAKQTAGSVHGLPEMRIAAVRERLLV